MNHTSPAASTDFSSTIRVDGRPSAPTVAKVIACGSLIPDLTASASHFSNCSSGASADSVKSGWS